MNILGIASFAQERIFLDERIRFSQNIAVYNELVVWRLTSGVLSLVRLRQAIESLLETHQVLRTSLFFNNNDGKLLQRIYPTELIFDISEVKTFKDDEELHSIIHQTTTDSNLFDLSTGRVFHYQLLRRQLIGKKCSNSELMTHDDVLLIAFHHVAFDGTSYRIFFDDLCMAYNRDAPLPVAENTFHYIDYSVYERQMYMSVSRDFWRSQLNDYDLSREFALPVDRHRLPTKQRSGLASTVRLFFDDDLSSSFLAYTSSHQLTSFQLGLATFYAFIFKLSNGENDLCVTSINANRYRSELQRLIGMFVAMLPNRIQLDPHVSFDQLVEKVRDQCLSILEHSHYPLQDILADTHHKQSTAAFLETVFDVITLAPAADRLILDTAQLERVSEQQTSSVAKFDFMLTLLHNPSATNKTLSLSLVCSQDLFDQSTVEKLSERFQLLLRQLFHCELVSSISRPLYELSIVLPNEIALMHALSGNDSYSMQEETSTIDQLFSQQADTYPQKLAVELDEQSLTYSELLFYMQRVALHLLEKYNVRPGEIICQCMERSLSMVIGIMAIEIAGAVYCPLSPRNPHQRLEELLKQTQSRLVLVHSMSLDKFKGTDYVAYALVDVDHIFSCVESYTSLIDKVDLERLASVLIEPESIAYVIFTSGSTGTPKAAQVRHRNFVGCIRSLLEVGTFSEKDTVVQMAECTFDMHMQDIVGTLIVSATVIMLHPNGNIDFTYLLGQLQHKQISFIQSVPSYMNALCHFIEEQNEDHYFVALRSFCSIGEPLSLQLASRFSKHFFSASLPPVECRLWNMYGPAETTLASTYYLVDSLSNTKNVSLGHSLPNYCCLLVDVFFQPVVVGQEGELLVGGVGVFAGYLGREDLTSKALIEINGQSFYRTGDLARLDSKGLLNYVGRKDFQVKLRGQRIEVGEIEQCLLNASSHVSASVVVKYGEDHLVAYVQSTDITEERLREHCHYHLPPFMVPSVFILLEQFPLNANGKIDRKCLPTPDYSMFSETGSADLISLTSLETRLQCIFAKALHIESPKVNVPFGQLGGTSLNAMSILTLIRQEICAKVDISILFSNPSVRQLARIVEPLLVVQGVLVPEVLSKLEDNANRPMPSTMIEALGILVLVCQWLLPIFKAYYSGHLCTFLLVPVFHLLLYVVFRYLLFWQDEILEQSDALYSYRYYRWWFLDRLWSINNSYWLQHLLGTPLYNSYLRLCGAQIGRHVHIYTTLIDAPWLLNIGDSTFIDSETVFSNLSLYDQTYELHVTSIGSHCSINTRSILYGGVTMQDYTHVEPMSAVTGEVSASKNRPFVEERVLSWNQIIYQLICLMCLLTIHGVLLSLTYLFYERCLTFWLPLPVCLAFSWLFWTVTSLFVVMVSMKFIVGYTTPGLYPFNSYYYLHKLWLRQLIISSFYHSFELLSLYEALSPILLRWLGAHVEDDVKLAELQQLLYFPSNLLQLKRGVTIFSRVKLSPFDISHTGFCCVDQIYLGSNTNLGNGCTLMPGTQLVPHSMVGSLTLITRETRTAGSGTVLLGIPGVRIAFAMSANTTLVEDSSLFDSSSLLVLVCPCFLFFISKSLFISLYWLLPIPIAPFIQTVFFCSLYHYITSNQRTNGSFTYSEIITFTRRLLVGVKVDFAVFIAPFISRTQFLVFLYRALGARIGRDVILSDIHCLTDPQLVSIGDHVRLNTGVLIQCHTFEQRVFKVAPVIVNHSSVLMSGSVVFPGSTLDGRNRLLPLTLVLKNDRLPYNTVWSGVPARQTE